MAQVTIYDLQAGVFKALAHPLRLQVIAFLGKEELCFSDLLEQTGGLKSNLSQHLSLMTAAGLLTVRRDARCNYYRVASPRVAKACALMHELLSDNIRKRNKLLLN